MFPSFYLKAFCLQLFFRRESNLQRLYIAKTWGESPIKAHINLNCGWGDEGNSK